MVCLQRLQEQDELPAMPQDTRKKLKMQLKFKHFVFLNVLDIILTWYALTYLGLSEGNPILSPIFNQIGLIVGLVLIKLIGIIVVATLRNHMPLNIKKISINIICFMFILVIDVG